MDIMSPSIDRICKNKAAHKEDYDRFNSTDLPYSENDGRNMKNMEYIRSQVEAGERILGGGQGCLETILLKKDKSRRLILTWTDMALAIGFGTMMSLFFTALRVWVIV